MFFQFSSVGFDDAQTRQTGGFGMGGRLGFVGTVVNFAVFVLPGVDRRGRRGFGKRRELVAIKVRADGQ